MSIIPSLNSVFANSQTGKSLVKKEFMSDGLLRSYYLHLLPDFNKKMTLPVVFILHGGGKADGGQIGGYVRLFRKIK